jgi:sugar phosphate isomerase/epimerase
MYLTGLADEAGADIETQIRATKELGWKWIEARSAGPKNIHDISDAEFDHVVAKLEEAGIKINCFGSTIANWGKSILDPAEISFEEARRAIPRMRRLGTKMIRVMSYKAIPDKGMEEQEHEERFKRMRVLNAMFTDAGIVMGHENCATWGGMGWNYTLRLLEAVPGMKLIFDTGNPIETLDYSKPEPRPMQSAWEFYQHVKPAIVHVQVKDGVWDAAKAKPVWTYPGEGQADLKRILADLVTGGYDGGLCIEPHMAVLYHDPSAQAAAEERYSNYVQYGKRLVAILKSLGAVV